MTEIELPTYRTIVPSEVFGKKTNVLSDLFRNLKGKPAVTQVTGLKRFKVPTQKETIDFIRTSAGNIDYSPEGRKPSEDDSRTIYSLKSLTDLEIRDIAKGNKDSLEHLERHIPDVSLREGEFYLETFNGIVPNLVLDSAEELASEEGTEIYERAIKKMGVNDWNLRIKLLEDGGLPDILELEYLMDRGVRDSDVFSVQGDFRDYQIVTEQIRLLYSVLGSATGLVSQVKNKSYNFLEDRAAITIRECSRCISGKDVIESIGGLAGIIELVLDDSTRSGQGEQNPFGGYLFGKDIDPSTSN